MQQYNIFPVPIFRYEFADSELLRTELVPFFKTIESNDQINLNNRYTVNSYTSFYSNADIIGLPQMDKLRSFIQVSAQTAHNSIGLDGELMFTNSWFSINRQYSYHETHNHIPDIWSGVYYLQATEEDATISFVNKTIVDTGWPYKAKKLVHTDFVSSQVTCPVKTGMLIIFPSYLEHKVNQQMADSDRFNIAFNMSVR